MTNPLTWLDGKKTVIGTACLVLSTFTDQVLIGFWDITSDTVPHLTEIMQTLDWTGLVLGGTGLAHKTVKYQRTAKGE